MKNMTILVFLVLLVESVIIGLLPVILKSIRKRFPSESSQLNRCFRLSHFDSEGTVIRTISSPVYYIKTVLMFLLTVGLVYMTYLLFISAIVWLKLLGIIWGLSSVVMILFLVSYIRRCKCYLSIDQRGIKGYYCNIHHLLIPKFETIDVTWDKVNKIELTEEDWGKLTIDGLKLYVGKSPRLKTTINLEMFPSMLVIDCINFHYANWQGVQDSESPLIEYKLEDNRTIRYLLGLGIYALTLLIALLIN